MDLREKKKFKKGESAKASQLKKGQIGKVTKILCENPALRRRILDMGVTVGVVIKIKKIAIFLIRF